MPEMFLKKDRLFDLFLWYNYTTMSENDIKMLMDLADEQLNKGVTREQALRELIYAGILDKDGKYTAPYQNLAKAVTPIRK